MAAKQRNIHLQSRSLQHVHGFRGNHRPSKTTEKDASATTEWKACDCLAMLALADWQHRFYGLNVFTGGKRAETRRCVHRNPFTRNLVAPERVDRVELLAPGMRRNRRGRDRVDVDVR